VYVAEVQKEMQEETPDQVAQRIWDQSQAIRVAVKAAKVVVPVA
jgi:hypothetical protein